MNFNKALDLTLKEFRLSAKAISEASGVSEGSLSRFRRGERDIHAANLERIVSALPPEAKQFFYAHCLCSELGDDGLATLLSAIAYHLKSPASDTRYRQTHSLALT